MTSDSKEFQRLLATEFTRSKAEYHWLLKPAGGHYHISPAWPTTPVIKCQWKASNWYLAWPQDILCGTCIYYVQSSAQLLQTMLKQQSVLNALQQSSEVEGTQHLIKIWKTYFYIFKCNTSKLSGKDFFNSMLLQKLEGV